MSRTTMYQFRIDEEEKAETFAILKEMGLKPAQAVRLFFRQIRRTHKLPFQIEHTPNEATQKILASIEYVGPFDSVDNLFADLESK